MDQLTQNELDELEKRLDHLEHIHPDVTWTAGGFLAGVIRGIYFLLFVLFLSAIVAWIVSYKVRKA